MSLIDRVTGQDLRDLLHRLIDGQTSQVATVDRLTVAIYRMAVRLTTLEDLVSELDTSTDELTAAVDDLLATVDPSATAALLAQIAEKDSQIAALQADDVADKGQITLLTEERAQLLADAQENVAKQQAATDKIRAVVPGPVDPTVDPEIPAGSGVSPAEDE